jgi:hypothetical protein
MSTCRSSCRRFYINLLIKLPPPLGPLDNVKFKLDIIELTFDEKSSKSLSLARNDETRRAKVEGAGEKAAEYLSADAARVVSMTELKEVMVIIFLEVKNEINVVIYVV